MRKDPSIITLNMLDNSNRYSGAHLSNEGGLKKQGSTLDERNHVEIQAIFDDINKASDPALLTEDKTTS